MPDQHAISVVVLGDGRYRPLCSCNWKGIRTPNRLAAESWAEQHTQYRAQVEAMKVESE